MNELYKNQRIGPESAVECLGHVFASEDARLDYFRRALSEKLKDPQFRSQQGFPEGSIEDILELSDPPYYTACPNPFADLFPRNEESKDRDLRSDPNTYEPFAADVSEGKNDPIYRTHPYHTKVPHKAVMRYILHYTKPGDLVFDGFCGTGMTGVAAQLCGDTTTVRELGYSVRSDGVVLDESNRPISSLGARDALLSDLSPAATFIAKSYNFPVDPTAFKSASAELLQHIKTECGWMLEVVRQI